MFMLRGIIFNLQNVLHAIMAKKCVFMQCWTEPLHSILGLAGITTADDWVGVVHILYCRRLGGCSIKGRPYPGPGPGASPPLPLGTRVGLASESQAGWSLYWGVLHSAVERNCFETVKLLLDWGALFFGMFILIFYVFGSNRNVDVRSKQDDRQSNTMIPHCWETQQLEGIQLHPLAMDFKTTLGGGPPLWWRI